VAPVVWTVDGERELIQMCWGFPPPKVGSQPVTNVRNVASRFWRAWLKPQHRCIVALTSFSEYTDTKPCKTPVWLALNK
jgi:putative SOS response-associated peptidase YedK